MARAAGLVVGGVLLTLAACWVFMVAMRTKFRPVQDRVRRMNRSLANPDALETAGQPGARAAVVNHIGRKTGTAYRTPVVAATAGDGFVIALPYGAQADWVRNVLAAGAAVVEHEGDRYRVTGPQLVTAAMAQPCFARKERWEHHLYGVREFLLLRAATPAGPAA